jgi:hypothetical protein
MPKLNRHYKVRRCLHRVFLNWLQENQSKFLTPKFYIVNRTDRVLIFSLPNLNPTLSFRLTTWELGVDVDWKGDCWDVLIYFESIPIKVATGYRCKLCQGDDLPIYPSRKALWVRHDFEPFLQWVNTELFTAKWLAISGIQDQCTWARLVNEITEKDDETIYLPVWLDR